MPQRSNVQRCNDATMQQRSPNSAAQCKATQRRCIVHNSGIKLGNRKWTETQRRNDATTQRRNDATTQRRNDAATQRRNNDDATRCQRNGCLPALPQSLTHSQPLTATHSLTVTHNQSSVRRSVGPSVHRSVGRWSVWSVVHYGMHYAMPNERTAQRHRRTYVRTLEHHGLFPSPKGYLRSDKG